MHELPLVFFTVLSQIAVGLALITYISYRVNLSDLAVLRKANVVALVLVAVAVVFSFFHLGKMFRVFNMLFGAGTSAMSNEIILCGAFFALLACTLFFGFIKKNESLEAVFNMIALIVGLVFIWSITKVYTIPTVINWDTPFTALQMWCTLLVGGGAVAALVGARKLGIIALFVGVILSFAFKPFYFSFLGEISPMLTSEQTTFWLVQLVCLAIALFFGAITLFKKENVASFLSIAAIAVVIGELSSRVAFYNLWSIPM
ncbi:MAG: dimethyl sulfoxide reductase anchor subunit family protein [Campylobacteraceae bacterium]